MADTRKVWLVELPAYQYKENVKDLARTHNLRIIDAKFANDFKGSDALVSKGDEPKLTLKAKAK